MGASRRHLATVRLLAGMLRRRGALPGMPMQTQQHGVWEQITQPVADCNCTGVAADSRSTSLTLLLRCDSWCDTARSRRILRLRCATLRSYAALHTSRSFTTTHPGIARGDVTWVHRLTGAVSKWTSGLTAIAGEQGIVVAA
jgi:hypothetical protein